MSPRDPGRTVDLSGTCQARTLTGKPCSRGASTTLDGVYLCAQHAASHEAPGIAHLSVLSARRKSLEILHFSDLHGQKKATARALKACGEGRDSAVVVITGDVGSYKRPRLDARWSRITPSERWIVPGNHERDRKAVFQDAGGWIWSCPWIRVIGRFALIGFDSGKETKGVISTSEVDLVTKKVDEVWEHEERRALVVASHHKPGGVAQARLSRRLMKILPTTTPVLFLFGHEHGKGSWEEGRLGPFSSWQSRICSCDRDPLGHRITLSAGVPQLEEIR